MHRLSVVLPLVAILAGLAAHGVGTANSDGAVSFNDAEKVHGVALVRRYVEEQGQAPDQATYRLDEQVSVDAADGTQKKSRKMFVVVEFKDGRQPWRILVLPDGTLRRVESGEESAAETGEPSRSQSGSSPTGESSSSLSADSADSAGSVESG